MEVKNHKPAPIPPAANSARPSRPATKASTSPLPICSTWAPMSGKATLAVRLASKTTDLTGVMVFVLADSPVAQIIKPTCGSNALEDAS